MYPQRKGYRFNPLSVPQIGESMNKKSIYIFTLILIVWPIYSLAACPDPNTVTVVPKLVDVEVKTSISLDEKTGIYSYSYNIKNGKENTGCIWWFEIDIKKPDGGVDLPKEGLINAKRFASLNIPSENAPPMIPVTFPSLPKVNKLIIWSAGLTSGGEAHWNSNRYTYQIMPGDAITGLVLTTYGLPSIRDFKIDPKYIAEDEDIIAKFGITKEELNEGNISEYLDAFYESLAWKGKTLGPTAPPANFVAIDFLSYLIDLKHQAAELGWITNPGVEDSLDVKLNQVKAKLQSGDTKTASNILNAFLSEVSAQGCESYDNCPNGKHLSPDAWGLLFFNGKYLLDQLAL